MTTEQIWMGVGLALVLLAGFGGYFIGRSLGGSGKRVSELESEVERQKQEVAGYKQAVESHFDKSATLFVSMAGSYKELFEHLSSGYEKLSDGSARELFKERVDALLVGGVSDERMLTGDAEPKATQADAQSGQGDAENTPADVSAESDVHTPGHTESVDEALDVAPDVVPNDVSEDVPEDVPQTPPNDTVAPASTDTADARVEREGAK